MKQYSISYTGDFRNTLEENGYKLIPFSYAYSKGKQIGSMQAWEVKAEIEDQTTGEVLTIPVLQSYYTLVAYKIGGKTVRCGKWSRTTSKQTSTWERM